MSINLNVFYIYLRSISLHTHFSILREIGRKLQYSILFLTTNSPPKRGTLYVVIICCVINSNSCHVKNINIAGVISFSNIYF